MAEVRVSSVRIRSMLRNRGQDETALAALGSTSAIAGLATEDRDVDFEELVALAKHFKRPWPYLLVDSQEEWRAQTRDHRTIGNKRVSPDAAEGLFDVVDDIYELLETARDVFPEEVSDLPPSPTSTKVDPAAAGAAIRSHLGVTVAEQLANPTAYPALKLWRTAIQERRIYVFQRKLPDAGVRAFSLSVGGHCAIVTSSGDTPYARVFSMLHEMTHLALRNSGLCDLSRHSVTESYCNSAAAHALLPEEVLSRGMQGKTFVGDPDADDALIARLSRAMGASQAAILIALREDGWINEQAFDDLEGRRTERRAPQTKSGGPTFYDLRIGRAGQRLMTQVFGALDSRRIEQETAGSMLEVKNHQLERLRQRWGEGGNPDG